jgi:glycerophosphoryl diester phosphodiesterase
VADFAYDELRRLDAGSWKSPAYAGERMATLAEAIETAWAGGTALLVELKAPDLYPGIVADVVATVECAPGAAAAVAAGKLVVQSFGFAAMKEHKTLAPSIPVGLLGSPSAANLPALATWADQVNPNHRSVDRAYVDRVRALGLDCQVWTVDRKSAMQRAGRLGVSGVITNRPEVLARLLAR